MVARSSACAAGSAVGSWVACLARNDACRMASNMSRSLLLAAPSVPRPSATPAARYFPTGAVPLASFMLLSGLCDTPTPRRLRILHVLVVHPHAMGGERPRPPEPDRLEIPGRRRLMLLARDLDLVLGLGQVDDERHLVAAGQRRGSPQGRLVVRVQRVGGHRRHDQRVALELLDEAFGAGQPLGRRLRIGDGKLDDRLAEDAAQTRFPRRAADFLLEVIHVGIGRRARLDHLERRQARPDAHHRGRHGLGFRGEDVFLQPLHQREVVGQTAIHDHRRVRVGIDQPGQDDLIARRRWSTPPGSATQSPPADRPRRYRCRRSRWRPATGSGGQRFR